MFVKGSRLGQAKTSWLRIEDHLLCFTCSLSTPALSDWALLATWGNVKEGGSGAALCWTTL